LVDKPAGPTSHDVVALARRLLGTRRVGHAGTLDPAASGLLPLLAGRATRLMPFLAGLDKCYTGTLRLGVRTATDDASGRVTATDESWREVNDERLRAAMLDLTGVLDQIPPAFSAKKLGGTPAHRRARRGETVAMAPARVVVHRFDLTGRDAATVAFDTEVGSGTYVRALARDLGEALGCGAHLVTLRRTRVGPWRVEEATPLAALAAGDVPLRDMAAAVPHLPARPLTTAEHALVRHGRPVPGEAAGGGPVALLVDGHLVAIAVPRDGALAPKVVLEA
jgi:tRNA pseudouridine55 synthase